MSTFPLENDLWYHVTMVAGGSQLSLYVNGVLTGHTTAISPHSTYAVPLTIGRRGTQNDLFLPGRMDECRISNVVRYTEAFTPVCAFDADGDTAGLWKFNEGTGNTVNDACANGDDGSITGATWEASDNCGLGVPASSPIGLVLVALIMAIGGIAPDLPRRGGPLRA